MKILTTLALALVSTAALAFPEAPFNALEVNLKRNLFHARDYDFEGIVKLSNCSGALVIFSGQPETSKAIVMTNGHCIQKSGGYLEPGETWVNRPLVRDMKLFDSKMNLSPIQSTKILYATMTDTDLAYYELTESYLEIERRTRVKPLLLDPERPVTGLPIEIISGYWDRGYSCDIDGFVFQIREGAWTFTDSIRYTPGCDTIGGTSGSPIIQKHTRTVVGINNTSNKDGKRCALNNPCEVDENGSVVAVKGRRYGQQTFQTYGCLTADFRIDLGRRGCGLPK